MENVLQRRLSVPEASRHAHDNGHLIQKLCLIVLVRALVATSELLQSWLGCYAYEPQFLESLDGQVFHRVIFVKHPQYKLGTNVSAALDIVSDAIEGS
jgi:hypothetical protein